MADSRTKRYDKPYHLMLDETHRAMLEQLAKKEATPASQVIRRWISSAYRMEFDAEPRCMSGLACLCPRVHLQERPQQISDEEILQRHRAANGQAEKPEIP